MNKNQLNRPSQKPCNTDELENITNTVNSHIDAMLLVGLGDEDINQYRPQIERLMQSLFLYCGIEVEEIADGVLKFKLPNHH